MYERSAIVLERYFHNLFGFQKEINLKINYKNYVSLVQELEKFQTTIDEEEQVIKEFDDVASKLQDIQKRQAKLSGMNIKLEEERGKLFNSLDDASSLIAKRLDKIENTIESNIQELSDLKENFIEYLQEFATRQVERNKCSRTRRVVEANHISFVKQVNDEMQKIDVSDVKKLKVFFTSEEEKIQNELIQIMLENGKNEKVKFDEEVIKKAVMARLQIAKKEVELYLLIFDKMRKLLVDLENDTVKLSKYQKTLRDVSVKFAFLEAEKEYIVGFLDNERMTTINGARIHADMMKEACQNFDLDIAQINNLYELVLREISGKATKKIYNELYNKTYLKEIGEREKNFEKEVNSMKIQGTVIDSNYWRIEGVKNLYEVFQQEVSEKFEKDLSEYKIEEDIEANGEISEELKEESSYDEELIDNEEDNYEDEYEIKDESYEDYDDLEEDYEEDDEYDFADDLEMDDENAEYNQEYEEDDYEDDNENEEYEDDYEDDNEYEEYEDDYEDDNEYEEEDDYEDDNEYEEDEDDYEEDNEYEEDEDNYAEHDEYEDYDEENEYEKMYRENSRHGIEKNRRDYRKAKAGIERGNIDERIAKIKEKRMEEKQNKGFLSIFKERKNKN